ncbi:FecR family protein [Niastella yeongjuensis]|uniref:FecR family protein n=1 Tax=Niastella yeongjuensis TaxID=354355 RepID=UPI0008BABE09|nr:FecR family protein [Niastella yeongjuensis]SEP12871.1 FecR family protein [Niastella yeongjuensis]
MDNSLLFATLFRKYLDNNCSPAEVDQLMDLLKDEAYKEQADEMIGRQLAVQKDAVRPVDGALNERLSLRLQSILETETPAVPAKPTHNFRRNRSWLAAAAVLLLLGTGTFMWLNRSTIPPKPPVVQEQPKNELKNDVLPGGNKALLTLGNGTTIILDSAHPGTLTQQGNTRVVKLNDGQLLYNEAAKSGTPPLTYNTLSTPRGGQYQLVLPDGSTVWLNAASSIRFPTAFTGNERNVEITGEAYFEVKKNAAMPFTVKMNNGTAVKVLGTQFNINAYDDEETIKTTLLEGAVKITKKAESAIIKPGEQASVSQSSNNIPVLTADLEEVMAWKNGSFQFNGATIETVMRQISRWYDVEVEYKGKISLHFAGAISRNVNISQVLEMLEKAGGIKTSITGKKVIVAP